MSEYAGGVNAWNAYPTNPDQDFILSTYLPSDYNLTQDSENVYAVWSPHAAVPEAATIALMGLGLVAMGFTRRKCNKI